ncbi:hypothetical protein KIM372_07630 [Bombiscardovia nodaiensis]|uniref:Fluoride-specific ion channel FluC n=1 Tax=Bombiscardovia nodaiensis TaxID=2932181 RepID=A0ABM8B7T0_9BIFI|nr:hypothetical protein KIM372_07630 [Bombiscardovia nodaiensis]
MPTSSPTPADTQRIDLPVLCCVVIGGTLGTAIRYMFSSLPPFSWYFYTGTFLANMIACTAYSALASFLAGAWWIPARGKELTNRTLGMGLCGGLSTLSALAVEVLTTGREGHLWSASIYLLLSFACGLVLAALGSHLGTRAAVGAGRGRKEAQ